MALSSQLSSILNTLENSADGHPFDLNSMNFSSFLDAFSAAATPSSSSTSVAVPPTSSEIKTAFHDFIRTHGNLISDSDYHFATSSSQIQPGSNLGSQRRKIRLNINHKMSLQMNQNQNLNQIKTNDLNHYPNHISTSFWFGQELHQSGQTCPSCACPGCLDSVAKNQSELPLECPRVPHHFDEALSDRPWWFWGRLWFTYTSGLALGAFFAFYLKDLYDDYTRPPEDNPYAYMDGYDPSISWKEGGGGRRDDRRWKRAEVNENSEEPRSIFRALFGAINMGSGAQSSNRGVQAVNRNKKVGNMGGFQDSSSSEDESD